MDIRKLQPYFILAVIIAMFVLTFFLFRSFLGAVVFAAVFAVVFQPLHRGVLKIVREKEVLAAFLSALIIMVVILVPIAFLSTQVFEESRELYLEFSTTEGRGTILQYFHTVQETLQKYFPQEITFDFPQYVTQGLQSFLDNLGTLFSSFTKIFVSAFIFLISLYYFLKDGKKFQKAFIRWSPLVNTHDEIILERLALAINSVVKGSLAVALIQGVLTSVGFAIFGLPHVVLWGMVTAFAALIPGVGTALVIVPAVVFLFLSGNMFAAVGLLIWGIVAVGLVDNILGPRLMGKGASLHPLLTLLSVLGGLAFFGPAGFLLGPLTLSLLSALLEMYA